jgi:hypothetical protein
VVGKAFVVVLSCLLLFRVVARGVVASALLSTSFPGQWNVKSQVKQVQVRNQDQDQDQETL